MSWAAARSSRFGRRCGDATRQPRCATLVRHRFEGNAGRRDYRDLRAIRSQAIKEWRSLVAPLPASHWKARVLTSAQSLIRDDGQIDTSQVRGVNPDLRVRPFFAHGAKISIRESLVGAFNEEMGLQSVDPDLMQAHNGSRIVTRSGMQLDGSSDQIEAPPTDLVTDDPDHDGMTNEFPPALSTSWSFICSTTSSRRSINKLERPIKAADFLTKLAVLIAILPI
jgi:hypothetical protein